MQLAFYRSAYELNLAKSVSSSQREDCVSTFTKWDGLEDKMVADATTPKQNFQCRCIKWFTVHDINGTLSSEAPVGSVIR